MTTRTDNLPPVDSLHFGCEDAQSREYDWSSGYGENYTAYGAMHLDCANRVECDQCDGGLVDQHDEDEEPIRCDVCDGSGEVACPFAGPVLIRSGLCECPDCGNEEESDGDEPMMRYYYPLPSHKTFTYMDALKLADLPLVLVNFHTSYGDHYESDDSLPEWALVLSGGGMDLSWEVAEAHMRLGLLPPLFTCHLPKYAGKDMTSEVNAWIIAGCRRTAEAVRNHGQNVMDDLDRLTGD